MGGVSIDSLELESPCHCFGEAQLALRRPRHVINRPQGGSLLNFVEESHRVAIFSPEARGRSHSFSDVLIRRYLRGILWCARRGRLPSMCLSKTSRGMRCGFAAILINCSVSLSTLLMAGHRKYASVRSSRNSFSHVKIQIVFGF